MLAVPLLTNYTAQSNDLGMQTKFYYTSEPTQSSGVPESSGATRVSFPHFYPITVRELSAHAVETHAFLSLQV